MKCGGFRVLAVGLVASQEGLFNKDCFSSTFELLCNCGKNSCCPLDRGWTGWPCHGSHHSCPSHNRYFCFDWATWNLNCAIIFRIFSWGNTPSRHEDTVVHAQIKFFIWEQNTYQHCTCFPVKHWEFCFFLGFMLWSASKKVLCSLFVHLDTMFQWNKDQYCVYKMHSKFWF
jgi:hypothetical protein